MNIEQIKKDTIEHIKNLKFTGQYSKEELVNVFENFTKEETWRIKSCRK